jgi:hypothetical protein
LMLMHCLLLFLFSVDMFLGFLFWLILEGLML